MPVLNSAGICIPKEKPQQGRQGFWKRTPLGGMGVRRIRFTAAFSMPKSFRLTISGQSFVWAGSATKIAPGHRELVKPARVFRHFLENKVRGEKLVAPLLPGNQLPEFSSKS
jgi:hypothetical protein